jgi:hypothetical protein
MRIVPLYHFAFLSILTGGFYPFLWVYQYWRFLQQEFKVPGRPVLRSLIHWVTAPQLMKQIQAQAKSAQLESDFSPTLFGISYYVLFLLRFLGMPFSFFALLSFVPFLPVVALWNQYLQRKHPQVLATKRLTKPEWVFVLVFWMIQFTAALLLLQLGMYPV